MATSTRPSSTSYDRTPADGAFCVEPATAGDHRAIELLLREIFHEPSPAEFQASLESPTYLPVDRLLLKSKGRLVGHVQLSWRRARYGGSLVDTCRLTWLGVLPEYADSPCAERLFSEAVEVAIAAGAVAIECDVAAQGEDANDWISASSISFTQANPRDLISYLSAGGPSVDKQQVRPWRQVELADLMRIYGEAVAGNCGPQDRDEDYWRWLVRRKAFDQIFVAVSRGSQRADPKLPPRILGYAVVRREKIVELLTDADAPDAARQLLERIGREALERDLSRVALSAPPRHPALQMFQAARAARQDLRTTAETKRVVLVPSLSKLVRALHAALRDRALAAGLQLPLECRWMIGDTTTRLRISRRTASLVVGAGRDGELRSGRPVATALLLGFDDAQAALSAGRLQASTSHAAEIAQRLLGAVLYWRSPWDDLPA